MILITVGILLLASSWICYLLSAVVFDDFDDKWMLFIVGSLLMVIGILVGAIGVSSSFNGYATNQEKLPVHGVCEVLYTTAIDADVSQTGVLIKLPDGQLRLFQLPEKPAIGLAKIQPDLSLQPFSVSPAPVLPEKAEEAPQ